MPEHLLRFDVSIRYNTRVIGPVEAHIAKYVRIRVVTRIFASLHMQRGVRFFW